MNLQKSSVFFSSNVNESVRTQLCQSLNIMEATTNTTYLGLPNMMGRSKSSTLSFLKDKVRKKIQTWDGRWISQAGREVLVKAVIQYLPTYAMSVFLLPMDIIKEFERMFSKYWWGANSNHSRKIHWMSWSRLCCHKSTEGLGFRDFCDFNLALLGKQCWRLLNRPNSLCSQIFKAKYFPNDSLLDAKLGNNPSFIWRSICEARLVIYAGARWKVGLGNSINILGQPWLADENNPYITSDVLGIQHAKVSSLLKQESTEWDEDILHDLFNDRDQNCIRQVHLDVNDSEDRLYWSKEVSGHYSVRSAYRLLQAQKNLWQREDNNSLWCKIWKIKAPPKPLNLLWRASSNCLPTLSQL